MGRYVGVIFPLKKQIVKEMFSNRKDVFIKYTTRPPSNKDKSKIRKGMKLFVYESGGSMEIIGEATIEEYDYLNMHSI